MKRILQNSFSKTALCLLIALLCGGTARAAEEVYKTALFGQAYSSEQINAYDRTWVSTYDGLPLTISHFKNSGSNGWYSYISAGEPNTGHTATITTNIPLDEAITKVTVTFDKLVADNVTSVKLQMSADGESWTEVGAFNKLKGHQSVAISTPTANRYYRIEAVITELGNGNYNFLKISKIEFFYNDPYLTEAPVITCNSAISPEFSGASTTVTIECPSPDTDATIQYSVDGGNQWITYSAPFELEETATIKAKALGSRDGMKWSHLTSTTFCHVDDLNDVTWDLTKASYRESDADEVLWEVSYATMTIQKGTSSNNANAYLGNGSGRTHTELYKNQVLTVAPTPDHIILSVEFTSTEGHVSSLNDRAWENATAVTNGNVVTVTPVNGTLPFSTSIADDGTYILTVKVNYAPASSPFVTAANVEIVSGANENGVVNIVYNRIEKNEIISETLQPCDANGDNASYEWITFNGFDSNKNVKFTVTGNAAGTARTAYMKVRVVANVTKLQHNVEVTDEETLESQVFAITQKAAFEVNISSARFATYVAPADVSFPVVSAYVVTRTTGTVAKLGAVEAVPAGTAVVLEGDEGTYYVLEEVTTPSTPAINLLKAVTEAFNPTAENTIYCLANKSKGVGFYPVATTVTIPVGKAYLEITGGEAKPFYGFEEEDDPTGIGNLNDNVNANANEGAIYNLAGQRLQKMQRGINIINGKKILK